MPLRNYILTRLLSGLSQSNVALRFFTFIFFIMLSVCAHTSQMANADVNSYESVDGRQLVLDFLK